MDRIFTYRYYLYIALLGAALLWYTAGAYSELSQTDLYTSPHLVEQHSNAADDLPDIENYIPDTASRFVEDAFKDTQDLGVGTVPGSIGFQTGIATPATLTWQTVYVTTKARQRNVDIEYPKFIGASTDKLNAYIEQLVYTRLTESIKYGTEVMTSDPNLFESRIDIASRYRVIGVRNGVVSFELVITSFTGGGNGNHDESYIVNWDLKSQRLLGDKDLLCPGASRAQLIPATKTALLTPNAYGDTPGESAWVTDEDGISFDSETNYFLLPTSGLIIVFPPYTVASGAAGVVRVRLPEQKVAKTICVP